jgi:hypothetical protein
MTDLPGPPVGSARSRGVCDTGAEAACRQGRWRCRVGWLVYLLVAGRLGLELAPVGLPGHFLVGCFGDDPPFFIDPFDRGVFRDAAELFDLLRARHLAPKLSDLAPTPGREVLCRCCRNLRLWLRPWRSRR